MPVNRKVRVNSPVRLNAVITLSVPADVKRKLVEKAVKVNTTLSNLCRQILTKVRVDTE